MLTDIAHTMGVKKPLWGRLSACKHQDANPVSHFFRDMRTVPEAVLFVKRFVVALHIQRLYTCHQAACRFGRKARRMQGHRAARPLIRRS